MPRLPSKMKNIGPLCVHELYTMFQKRSERFYSSGYWNKRNCVRKKRVQTPSELVLFTNMASVSLFWNTNMAAVTSCENIPYILIFCFVSPYFCTISLTLLMSGRITVHSLLAAENRDYSASILTGRVKPGKV